LRISSLERIVSGLNTGGLTCGFSATHHHVTTEPFVSKNLNGSTVLIES